jgi:hypothetical protein
LNEYSVNFKVSGDVYKECKDENEKLKFEVNILKSQIQNNNEHSFITQVRNKRLEILSKQKIEIEEENKLLKNKIICYEIDEKKTSAKISVIEEKLKVFEQENSILKINVDSIVNSKNSLESDLIELQNKLKAKDEILNYQLIKIKELEIESSVNNSKILETSLIKFKQTKIQSLKQSFRLESSEHENLENEHKIIDKSLKTLYEYSKLKLNAVVESNRFGFYFYIKEIKLVIDQLVEKTKKLNKQLGNSVNDNKHFKNFNCDLSIENAELLYEISKLKKQLANQQFRENSASGETKTELIV